jgi:hypothetical protein
MRGAISKGPGIRNWKSLVLGSEVAGTAFSQSLSMTPSASIIAPSFPRSAQYAVHAESRGEGLGGQSPGGSRVPGHKKRAFIIGAQYGYGSLQRRGKTVAYYRTGAASYGFQAGVKQFGYALFFMTNAALKYLDESGGWAIGTGPSIVVVDQGAARSLTTTSLRADVYAFVFDQKGLMGGVGIEGSKITRITPTQ